MHRSTRGRVSGFGQPSGRPLAAANFGYASSYTSWLEQPSGSVFAAEGSCASGTGAPITRRTSSRVAPAGSAATFSPTRPHPAATTAAATHAASRDRPGSGMLPVFGPPNTPDQLRRRRSPNGEREAAAATPPLPARPPRGAVSCIRSLGGRSLTSTPAFVRRHVHGRGEPGRLYVG